MYDLLFIMSTEEKRWLLFGSRRWNRTTNSWPYDCSNLYNALATSTGYAGRRPLPWLACNVARALLSSVKTSLNTNPWRWCFICLIRKLRSSDLLAILLLHAIHDVSCLVPNLFIVWTQSTKEIADSFSLAAFKHSGIYLDLFLFEIHHIFFPPVLSTTHHNAQ